MKYHVQFSRSVRRRLLVLFGVVAALVGIVVAVAEIQTTPARRSPIAAGDSKANCVGPDFPNGVVNQAIINSITSVTGRTYNCLNVFDNPMPTWADWVSPWMFSTTSDGWDSWLASSPQHQVIMGQDLIPQSVSNTSNPLTWEAPCASGAYNQYATTLATNLLSYGAGSIVIRLGIEANGPWEADYVGTSSTEMSDWGKCYANEVTAMNKVSGTHFLFVWTRTSAPATSRSASGSRVTRT